MGNVLKVEKNRCGCHPETCSCDDWILTYNGEILARHMDKEKLEQLAGMTTKREDLAGDINKSDIRISLKDKKSVVKAVSHLLDMATFLEVEGQVGMMDVVDRLKINENEWGRSLAIVRWFLDVVQNQAEKEEMAINKMVETIGEAINWDGQDDEGVPAVWLDRAKNALFLAARAGSTEAKQIRDSIYKIQS